MEGSNRCPHSENTAEHVLHAPFPHNHIHILAGKPKPVRSDQKPQLQGTTRKGAEKYIVISNLCVN